MTLPKVMMALALVAGLAGCMGDPGVPDEVKPADAELEFQGSGNGEHEKAADCDGDGRLDGNGEVTDGQVTLTVTDGSGNQKFQRDFSGPIELDETLSGASGTWTMKAQRGGDDLVGDAFQGRYEFSLTC